MLSQSVERLLQLQQLDGLWIRSRQVLAEREPYLSAATLLGSPTPSIIDENMTDHSGRYSEEMRSIPPCGRRLIHELQVRLMDHGGGAERVTRPLGSESPVRDAP
jgi:hypothetical protein